MTATDLSELEAARAALGVADTAARRARAGRQAAQAAVNAAEQVAAARHEAQRRQQWADPALVAALRDAKELVAASAAELDELAASLRGEVGARFRREGKDASPGLFDAIGTSVAEDPRYLAALRTHGDARNLRLQAQRALTRGAQQREHETHAAERDRAIAARQPASPTRGHLAALRARLPGQPRRQDRAGLDRSLSVTDEVS